MTLIGSHKPQTFTFPSSSSSGELTAMFKEVRFSDCAIRYNDSAIGHHRNGDAATTRWNSCEVNHRKVRKKRASLLSAPQRKRSVDHSPPMNRSSSPIAPQRKISMDHRPSSPSAPQLKRSMDHRPRMNKSSSDHGQLGATDRSTEYIPKRKSSLDSRTLSSRSLMGDTESSSLKPLAYSDLTLRPLTGSDSSLDHWWSPLTSDSDHTADSCIPERHMSDNNPSTDLLHETPPKAPDEDDCLTA
jgi:hypothetical protein